MTDHPPPLLPHADLDDPAHAARQQHSLRLARRGGSALLLLLLLGGGLRLAFNYRDASALQSRTAASLTRSVNTSHARLGAAQRSVALPATLQGNRETVIYARSNGYLSGWYKTIGDRVKQGELLATVEAPEQTQELAQARASREQFKAKLAMSGLTRERWEGLRQQDAVSQQDLDEKRSAYRQAEADFAAADANVKRLEQLESFRRIVAPFAGVITRRSVDVGALVAPGGKELFAISQSDPLRLSLWVPQAYASEIEAGQEVSVRLDEYPGQSFKARIDHLSGAIDSSNRARQIDILLPNPEGKLLPGAYAEVAIGLKRAVNTLVIPPNALIFGQEGPRVAVVGADNRLEFRPLHIGRDLGKEVEVIAGLTAADQLVLNPSDLLESGELVQPQAVQVAAEGKAGKR
jgi:RND family efflux transporter MFP subunit